MNKKSHSFVRLFFFVFICLFMVATTLSTQAETTFPTIALGLLLGVMTAAFLYGLDLLFKKFHLLAFNTTLLGLFFGYLMGWALMAIFQTILSFIPLLHPDIASLGKIVLFFSGLYLGVMMTLRASQDIAFSLPFLKFSETHTKGREILLDASMLNDERFFDLAASGLIDGKVTLPRFLLKEFYEMEASSDEMLQAKGRQALECLNKLEALPHLHLRTQETDFPDIKETSQKILKLAALLNAYVLSADVKSLPPSEEVRIINFHLLAHTFKPLMQRGESLNIKIQRYGKEEMQGVGYLEDGTMIVVNGGADYIGKTVKACVLSVIHTQTGRMVFCNVAQG